MDDRIFLNEYRVLTTKSAQWWEARRIHFTCEAEKVGSGERVTVDLVPLLSLDEGERGERERVAAALRQLRHPSVPAVRAFGVENGRLAVVTETVAGLSAKEWVETFGAMPVADALGIGIQVASAWHAATRHAIPQLAVHPGNLTVVAGQTTEEGWPLVKLPRSFNPAAALTDLDRSDAMSSEIAAFASPERIAGAPMDFRSRVYSLGGTLWFLISGEAPPFPTLQLDERHLGVPDSPAELATIAPCVNRLLTCMLSERRDQRPLDPVVLERALRACLSNSDSDESTQPISAALAPLTKFDSSRRGWRQFGVQLIATASAAAILALVLSAWSTSEPAHHRSDLSSGDAGAAYFRPDSSVSRGKAPEIQTTVELFPSGIERGQGGSRKSTWIARVPNRSFLMTRSEAQSLNPGKWQESTSGVQMVRDARPDAAGSAALRQQR